MQRTDRQCLEDIIVAVHRIQDYVGERDYGAFVADRMLLDAVERNLITIGEAASRLSEEVRNLEPAVEWGLATGLRNIVVHKYFGVGLQNCLGRSEQRVAAGC